MLRACASPGHSPSNYSRKKHKRKDILSVMDHAIRQAVDSDSEFDASDSKDVKDSSKSPRVLQQRQEGEDKHTVKSVEEEYQHHPPAFQGLQVEALEKKITSLQSLVGDLKRSVEGFTSRVEEDVGAWQCRVQGVEAEMMNWRDQADSELMNMRGDIQAEVQKKLEELTKGLNKVERTLTETESRKETTKQRLEARLEECTAQLDSVKEQVDSIVSDLKLSLSRDMKERVQDMTKGLKGDLNLLEVGISKDLESVRKELDERFHDFCVESEKAMRLEKQQLEAWVEERVLKKLSPRIDIASGGKIDKALAEMKNELRTESERLRRAERQQIEVLIEERIQSRLTQPMEIVSGGKEKVMAEMKEELQLLWAEVDLLIEGREKIKDNMEQLNQVAEKAKEAIGKEHDLLKTENGSLKKQLQYFRKETMQLQMDSNDYKKETELEMTEFKENIRKLKQEGEDVKKSIDWLKKVQDNLIHDNESLRSLVEGVREESVVKIREAITMKRETEEYEMLRNAKDGNRDKALMEKVDKLSQLYLGGLEEIRLDLKNMKAACDNRIDELESQWGELKRQQENNAESEESLRGLVLDGLEMRLSHLENLLERKENLDHKLSKVQSIIDTIKKEREYAASALAQVTTASQKAEEFLTNTLDSFQSEMTDIQRQSIMIQEKIQSEKEAAAAALSEVLHMRDHLEKETEATISLLSDAKSRTMQFQEGLESGREALRSSITMAEEEREAAVLAAAGVAAAAEQADRALVEISEVRKKSISLSDHFTDALGDSHKKYNEILEDHIEECKKSILDEVSKAREHVELIEQERRKSLNDIEGWREKMRGEVDSAKILVEGIQEEKRKSVCIAEIEAAREKHDFEQHKQATNAMIEELGNAIREMVETLDSKLHTVSQQQFHAEQQDENFRKEIGELREKVEKAFMDLDRLAHESSQVAQELQSNRLQGEQDEHARSEMLQKDISALENIIRQTAAEQVTVLDKMERIEKTQNELVLSIEEIQSSTQELERSCVDWLQKYDVAARVLQDIEKRISSIENASLDEDNSDQRLENVSKCHQIAPQEKLRLIRLYRELSAFLQKMKSSVENTENLNTDGCFEDEWSKIFNDKMMALDTRMKHVETDAFPKLIELETKTEELSIGIQSALDGASNAENKCSALGAELVKVFRLLASSRKESPTKMMMGDGPDEDTEQHHLQHRSRCTRSHHAGSKSKSFSSHGACTFYKKAATKGSNDLVNCTKGDHDGEHIHLDKIDNTLVEGPKPGYYYDGSHFDNMSSNIDRGYIKENTPQGRPLIETQDISHGRAFHEGEDFILEKASKGNVSQNGKPHWKGDILEKIDGFDGFEHFLAKKNLSELKNFEGKLPLTQEKIEDGRLDCAKKSVTHTGSGKNCQSTNIRLETGKIQVNVSHRSAVMSGNRLTKRGDAISVRP
ncbi:hypothetical protein KP509_26G032200 [Ceratopteris richardii]|nr:hypothetical protein KP509_26G032200 [Ceratopteris richardii]